MTFSCHLPPPQRTKHRKISSPKSCDEQNCWFYGSSGALSEQISGTTKSRPICCCACSLSSLPFFMRNLDLRTCNLSTITFVLSLLLIINNSPTRFIWFLASKSLLRRSVWLQWRIAGIPNEIDDALIEFENLQQKALERPRRICARAPACLARDFKFSECLPLK